MRKLCSRCASELFVCPNYAAAPRQKGMPRPPSSINCPFPSLFRSNKSKGWWFCWSYLCQQIFHESKPDSSFYIRDFICRETFKKCLSLLGAFKVFKVGSNPSVHPFIAFECFAVLFSSVMVFLKSFVTQCRSAHLSSDEIVDFWFNTHCIVCDLFYYY